MEEERGDGHIEQQTLDQLGGGAVVPHVLALIRRAQVQLAAADLVSQHVRVVRVEVAVAARLAALQAGAPAILGKRARLPH